MIFSLIHPYPPNLLQKQPRTAHFLPKKNYNQLTCNTRSTPAPYLLHTCSTVPPLGGTRKWRNSGETVEQVWLGWGTDADDK